MDIIDAIDDVKRKFRPLLTRDKELDLRACVSYGPKWSFMYMISVYMLGIAKGTGTRGGDIDKAPHVDLLMLRTMVLVTTSELEQLSIVQNFLEVVALRMDCEYKQRLRCDPKPQRSEAWIYRQLAKKERDERNKKVTDWVSLYFDIQQTTKEHKWLSKT